MRTKTINIYNFDELSDKAEVNAHETINLDQDGTFERFEQDTVEVKEVQNDKQA